MIFTKPLRLRTPKPKKIMFGLKDYTDEQIKHRMAELAKLGYKVEWQLPPPGANHNGVLRAVLVDQQAESVQTVQPDTRKGQTDDRIS